MSSSDNDIKQPLNKNFKEPKIRFPDFESSWTQKRLQDISTRINCRNMSMETNLVLTISAQYGLIDQTKFFNKSISTNGLDKYYLLHQGDFAYNRSYSKDYSYGAIKRLDNYSKGLVSTLYIAFRPKQNIDSDYLSYYFETDKWNLEIAGVSGEGARNHGLLNISPIDFFNTKHWLPESLQEQQKIGMFFNCLFQLSATISEEIDALKKYKEGLIGNLYDSNKDTRVVPLSNILEEYSKKNAEGHAAVAVGKYGIKNRDEIYSKELTPNILNNKVIYKNTLVIGMGTKEIDIGILTQDKMFSVSPAYRTFEISNINPIYLNQVLSFHNKLLSARFMVQSARQGKTVDVNGFLKFSIKVHNENIQNLFEKTIDCLDKYINAVNEKLNCFNKIKEYMLRNMFI